MLQITGVFNDLYKICAANANHGDGKKVLNSLVDGSHFCIVT